MLFNGVVVSCCCFVLFVVGCSLCGVRCSLLLFVVCSRLYEVCWLLFVVYCLSLVVFVDCVL